MRKTSLALGIAAGMSLAASAAFTYADAAHSSAKPATKTTKTAAAQSSGAPAADHTFMTKAAGDGLAEVQLGQLATQKASSSDVKSFGQMMVDDHGKANQELMSLAGQKGVTLPSEPPAPHKATYDRLSKLSGAEFDRAYAAEMVKDHEKAVSMFRQESTSGRDADAKGWAAKTLPTLETHLTRARALAGNSGSADAGHKH
jgi:putative membrane protein